MDDEREYGWVFGLIAVFCVILVMGIIFFSVFTGVDIDYVTIEGEIIDSETVIKENGEIDYLILTFDNGEIYKVGIGDDVDLTVNSRLIIELKNFGNRFWFWDDYDYDDIYYIDKIIKVPEKPCHLE